MGRRHACKTNKMPSRDAYNKIIGAGLNTHEDNTLSHPGPFLCYIISMVEQYGLGDPLVDPAEAKIDIVFIHGLGGDRARTWT